MAKILVIDKCATCPRYHGNVHYCLELKRWLPYGIDMDKIYVDCPLSDNNENSIQLALDLAAGHDGFDTVDGLKSLIDDMVKALKGKMEIIDIAAHRQEGEE